MSNPNRLLMVFIVFCLISITFIVVNYQAKNLALYEPAAVPMSEPSGATRARDMWDMFSHDLQHTGNTSDSAPTTNYIRWTNTTGTASESYSSPTVGYGNVYVGTGSSYLYCFDEHTGEKKWSKYFNMVSWGQCGSATLANGNLYVGAEDSYVYCLNPTNGNEVWSYKTNNAVWSCPAVLNGKVYIGSADRYVYCIDESSGNLVWKYETNQSSYGYQDYGVSSSPAIANGRLFIGACDGNLTCLPLSDPNTDGLINSTEKYWEFDTGCYIYASPTVYQDKVYIGTGSYSKLAGAPPIYKLYCLNVSTGAKIWEYTTGSYILATPSIGYGKLFIGSLDGKMYCLPLEDPNDNGVISEAEVLWKFDTYDEIWGSVALAENRVYFGSGVPYWATGDGDYRVYCLPVNDPNGNGVIATDEIIWDYQIAAGVLGTPAIIAGRLYVLDYDGTLYCFGEDTTPPQVVSTTPDKDEIDVILTQNIEVEFDENIDAASLTSTTFKVEDASAVELAGVLSFDSITFTATFDPAADFKEGVTYTVTLTTGVQDPSGNGLDCNANGLVEPGELYSWSFTTATYPPEISAIPTQRPVEGEDWTLNMELYASDPNTPFEELVFTENSTYAEVSGAVITFNYPNDVNSEIVNVTVSDGISTVWRDVLVEVKQTNDAPVLASIPDIQAVEDIDKVLNLTTYVSDIDNALEELTVTENSSYAKVSSMEIMFNYPNGVHYEMVNITVSDANKQTSQHVRVDVTPVNDAPELAAIPDQDAEEDVGFVLDVTEYITDIDNTHDELTVSTNSSYATVEKTEGGEDTVFMITFHYPEGILYELVNITVTDGDKSTSGELNIDIEPVNDPPTLDVIPTQNAVEDIDFWLDLSEYVTDIDTLFCELTVDSDSEYQTTSDGLSLTFNYPNGIAGETLNLTVSDGDDNCFGTVTILVTPVNDAPRLSQGQVEPDEGDTDQEFTFTVKYTDIDGDDSPTVEVVIDDTPHEMTVKHSTGSSVSGIRFEYKTKLRKGTRNYYFQCDDNSNEPNSTTATSSATVKVTGEAAASDAVHNTVLYAILGVVIVVIIVVLVLVFMMLKKRKSPGEEPPPPPMVGPPRAMPPEPEKGQVEIEWDGEDRI